MTINELTISGKPFSNPPSAFNAEHENDYYRQTAGWNITPVLHRALLAIKATCKRIPNFPTSRQRKATA